MLRRPSPPAVALVLALSAAWAPAAAPAPGLASASRPAPVAPAWMHSPHDIIEAWAISPDFEHDRTLFVSLPRFNLVLRTRDAGDSFQTVAAGLATAYVVGLSISPDFAHDATLWCNDVKGLFVSHDAGDRWTPLPVPDGLREATSLAVSPDFAADGTLAIGTRQDGLWISRDRGASWAAAPWPPDATRKSPAIVTAVTFSPEFASDRALLAVSAGAQVVVSVDGGRSFVARDAPAGGATALVVGEDFGVRGTLWAGTRGPGVWRSDDRGASWTPEGAGTDGKEVLGLSRARAAGGGVLFAATAVDGVLIRQGDGAWTGNRAGFREPTYQTQQHYTAAIPSPAFERDHTVFAATFEGLYVSTAGGDDNPELTTARAARTVTWVRGVVQFPDEMPASQTLTVPSPELERIREPSVAPAAGKRMSRCTK